MKNMLFLAGSTTLLVASLLLWMDNALADYLEKHPAVPAPQMRKIAPQNTRPEKAIRINPVNLATAALHPATTTPWQCRGACSKRIP